MINIDVYIYDNFKFSYLSNVVPRIGETMTLGIFDNKFEEVHGSYSVTDVEYSLSGYAYDEISTQVRVYLGTAE